ncbi:MAG: permease-like cell division protein FtsX [Desulfuromonadia bacterium]
MGANRFKPTRTPSTHTPSAGFPYFLRRAVLNIRQNPVISSVTIVTIALALLIVGVFLLIGVNLEGVSLRWSEKIQVVVYFNDDLSPQVKTELRSRIMALPETLRIDEVTRGEAMTRFRARLKGQETLLEGVSPDILPSSFEISLRRPYRNPEAIAQYVERLRKIPGMGEIQYGEEWVRRFTSFIGIIRFTGLLVALFLFITVVFIVSNTIRLTIYARREELEILSLVGATRMFIRLPFLIEGIIQGGLGGLLAVLILSLVYLARYGGENSFIPQNLLGSMTFLSPLQLLLLCLGGVFLGLVGSLTSLRRFMIF